MNYILVGWVYTWVYGSVGVNSVECTRNNIITKVTGGSFVEIRITWEQLGDDYVSSRPKCDPNMHYILFIKIMLLCTNLITSNY